MLAKLTPISHSDHFRSIFNDKRHCRMWSPIVFACVGTRADTVRICLRNHERHWLVAFTEPIPDRGPGLPNPALLGGFDADGPPTSALISQRFSPRETGSSSRLRRRASKSSAEATVGSKLIPLPTSNHFGGRTNEKGRRRINMHRRGGQIVHPSIR